MKPKKKGLPNWAKIALGILAISVVLSLLPDQTPKLTADEKAKNDSIQKQNDLQKARLDTLQKCYVAAKMKLKEHLKDPDSYEEEKDERYFVTDSPSVYIQIKIKYRAKNSFGALNLEQQCFDYNKNLVLIDAHPCP